MLKEDSEVKKELIELYENHGKINADECKGQIDGENILEVYNSLNDYILDGMPCDRINGSKIERIVAITERTAPIAMIRLNLPRYETIFPRSTRFGRLFLGR